ncbi:rRNA biogenesis protein rrp5 [Binucleata daphniae]
MLRVKVIQENNFKFVFGLETTKNTETYNTNCSDNTIVMNKRIFYDLENGLDVISNQNKGDMTDNNNEFNLKPGMIKEAIIKNYHKIHGTFVVVDGYTGIMKKCETSKDYVSDIERYLIGKKTVKGMIYNVNEKEKKFMFSVRKYETRANDFDGDTEMSVPFKKHKKQHNENEETDDKNNDKCDSIEINKIENNKTHSKNEVTETKCNDECDIKEINKTDVYKFVNSDYNIFYVNNIKNEYENITDSNEKKAYIENKMQNSKENDKYEFYCILLAKLMILEKENVYEIVKKYYKTNSEAFFAEVIETLENYNIENNKEYQNIYKLYYKTYKNEPAYQKLVKYNLNNKIEDDNIYKNEHKHLAIPILYELAPNEARVRTEKILHKDYNAWKTYIETEIQYKSVNTIEYIRNLFRRAVENGFSVSETKDMFKKWLEFEKKNDGDCEEVTNKAKEYVEKINKA